MSIEADKIRAYFDGYIDNMLAYKGYKPDALWVYRKQWNTLRREKGRSFSGKHRGVIIKIYEPKV